MKSYKKTFAAIATLTSLSLMGITSSYAATGTPPPKKTSAFSNFFAPKDQLFFLDLETGVIANDEGRTVSLYGIGTRLKLDSFALGLDYRATGKMISKSTSNVSGSMATMKEDQRNRSLIEFKAYRPVKLDENITLAGYIGGSVFKDKIDTKINGEEFSTATSKQKYLTTGMRFEVANLYLDATVYRPIGKQSIHISGLNSKANHAQKKDPFVTFMLGVQF